MDGFFVYTFHHDDDAHPGWKPLTDQEAEPSRYVVDCEQASADG